MNTKPVILSFGFLLLTFGLYSQQVSEKAMAAYFKAKEYGSKTQWEEGIVELQKAIKIEPKYTQAKALLAEFHFALKQYDEVIGVLEPCIQEKDLPVHSIFVLSEAFLRKQNPEKAKQYAALYLEQPVKNPTAVRKAEQTVRNVEFAAAAKKNPVPFSPKNLGATINTPYLEYFPYMTPDGKWLAFTRMQQNQEDLYIAQKTDTGFAMAVSFGDVINTDDNEGAETMNADGSLLFFTACNRRDGYGSCDIYFSQKINSKWITPMGIGKPVNTGAWEAQPSFSSDGRSLYFTSNRKGGFGGKDIWMSYLDDQMRWSEPQNLGPEINTVNDDQCPFIHADNQTLYFTSNGWPGMGGGDIYFSRKTDTGWTKAENLGYPINTENDDNALTVSFDGKTAFLSSSREGGFGGLDIYSFELPENAKPQRTTYIKALVKDKQSRQLLNANYIVTDLETGNEIYKGTTPGGSFFVSILSDKNYGLQIQKDNYLFYSQNVNLKEIATQLKPYELEIFLEPLTVNSKIVLNNVFFDFDKSELKSASYGELDKLAELLQKSPQVKIEIGGHTDNVGDKKYNLSLSQKRADSVVSYLVQKGIASARLIAKGYGDTLPVAANDTEENKARNRRTEVKVL
jgi:outer membrane protein OmpA-like peptidoglycan-associated protein/Tol biopolymer transport system component